MTSLPPEGGGTLDLEDFESLVFRVKGDGRKYLANIRTENWLVGDASHDIWQAFLFARQGCTAIFLVARVVD
jgi:NADH dehydrogenase [ubiquinone] 1 alpha subcomplex assembly factor 1